MGSGPSKKRNKNHQVSPNKSSSSSSDKSEMTFFRKQSPESKKRLQHQLYLAREDPSPMFDVSHCELSEVPSGVFSLCKVLQKEALIAHTNWLTSLKGGGLMKDLAGLRVLDLHNNELTHLPDDIECVSTLQVLNCECNKLKDLPDSIGCLKSLQTLNIKGNKLKLLPDSLCNLRALRTLDISQNHITSLPKKLCYIRTLDTLILDADKMEFPSADICQEGTEAIMRFLSSECNIEYIPPSEVLLDVLDSPQSSDDQSNSVKQHLDTLTETVMKYENIKARKQQERLELERRLDEEQRRQAELAINASSNKQHLLTYIAKDRERMEGEIEAVQLQRDESRKKLLDTLREAEENASRLVSQMLEMNEKAQKTEELLDALEKERMETEQWFVVRQEEANNLRTAEVLAAMEKVLEENASMQQLLDQIHSQRHDNLSKARKSMADVSEQVDQILSVKQQDQQVLIQELMKEEELQKEAFGMLQQQKDVRHHRITGQIQLIEQELAQLTMLEVEQRYQKVSLQKDILEEKRKSLTQLLLQLLEQRDMRAMELRKRMAEMEEQRERGQIDYWLVQYQRLMDRKPQSLMDQENNLEVTIVKILEKAGASDYISVFARHRITIETLKQMTEEDLQQMGVRETGLRKAIISARNHYVKQTSEAEEAAAAKLKLSTTDAAEERDEESPPEGAGASSASAPPEVVARGINSECVVCMDNVSSTLFLNCGHVCCCESCSRPIKECPLCRSDIVQRIQLISDTLPSNI